MQACVFSACGNVSTSCLSQNLDSQSFISKKIVSSDLKSNLKKLCPREKLCQKEKTHMGKISMESTKSAILGGIKTESKKSISTSFMDEGDNVEVRVTIPDEYGPITASRVAVTTHDDSLLLTLSTEDELIPLLVASPLYASVSTSETVWFLDENELVVNLQKVEGGQPWPDLVAAMGSLSRGVGVMLKSCSVNNVGENSDANWAVARELASALGYVPIKTRDLVESVAGKSVEKLAEEEGNNSVAEVEAAVLSGLTTNVRCLVSTMAGPLGAASSQSPRQWRSLHAGVTVWLHFGQTNDSEFDAAVGSSSSSPFARSDVKVVLGNEWDEEAMRVPAAEGVLKAVKKLLESDRKLTSKKGLYLRLGCRGDWPEIMPPGWNPDSPAVDNPNV